MDWKSPDFRRQLILQLKDAGKELIPYIHTKDKKLVGNEAPVVHSLLIAIEMALLHGIKIREFQMMIPFWGLLERLEVLRPPCIPLRNSVGAVACASKLSNPLGKARGWIRQALNAQNLDESIVFLASQTEWTSKFYYPESIICTKDDAQILVCSCSQFFFYFTRTLS
jgi:hypothetical protein